MRPSRILSKFAQNEPALITLLHFTDYSAFEMTSLMGFDGIWIDLEHHGHNMETAHNMMRAARVGASDIVARPAKGEFMRLGRLLEAGAHGIIYPRCDNAAEACEVVKWAKFPPLGKRGVDGGNPDMPYCSMPLDEYVIEANRNTFVVIQIEEPAALEHVEEIAAVDGVDVIMLGPADFSSLAGIPGQLDHPIIQNAMERIAAATKRAGKQWGRPVDSLKDAQKIMAMGAKFILHGADIVILKQGLESIQNEFGAAGFTFINQFQKKTTAASGYIKAANLEKPVSHAFNLNERAVRK